MQPTSFAEVSLERLFWICRYIAEGSANHPMATTKAGAELLEAGLTVDPELVHAAVKAHYQALDSAISNPNLVASKADFGAG